MNKQEFKAIREDIKDSLVPDRVKSNFYKLLAGIDRLTAERDAIEKLCLKAPSYGISAGKFAVEIAKVLDGRLEERG